MNEIDMFPVPLELLAFMDNSYTMNPELYRQQAYQNTKSYVETIIRRVHYLKVTKIITFSK